MFCDMSSIAHSIETVRRVHSRVGSKRFAEAAGVPYTTVREAQARGFVGPAVNTLIKLSEAAEKLDAEVPDAGQGA